MVGQGRARGWWGGKEQEGSPTGTAPSFTEQADFVYTLRILVFSASQRRNMHGNARMYTLVLIPTPHPTRAIPPTQLHRHHIHTLRTFHTLTHCFFLQTISSQSWSIEGRQRGYNWHQQRRIYSSRHEHHPTALTSAPRRNTRATRIAIVAHEKRYTVSLFVDLTKVEKPCPVLSC